MAHARSAQAIVVESRAATVPSDCDSALERACEIIVDAGRAGARWVIFPEACIPGYPPWVWATLPGDEPLLDLLRAEALGSTVPIPSNATDRLCSVAQRAQVNVAIGVIECDDAAGGPAYNTLLFIDTQGLIVGKYRAPLSNPAAPRVWVPAPGATTDEQSPATAGVSGI